ncbi:MAG: serine/threonine-protein kinase [Planctomycetales bacterium]
MTTTIPYAYPPAPGGPRSAASDSKALFARYEEIAWAEDLHWSTRYRKVRLLGAGGQGAVYLAQRLGADGFARHVALKAFSPEPYHSDQHYLEDMARVGEASSRVALIASDNVVYIHDFVEHSGIRLMEMEWLDGFDIKEVLHPRMLERTREKVAPERLEYIHSVILTEGVTQPRLKPGVAIAVLRDCLAGLAALHAAGIVHGDLKPANVMLTRTGNSKIIDIGSTINLRHGNPRRVWSPAYAAPEVLNGQDNTPRSDLASLGYILVEMLAGQPLFEGLETFQELLTSKKSLAERLPELLPPEVGGNDLLLHVCRQLIAFEPDQRFPSAQAADVGRKGAADFHRQLVRGNLATEYEHDLRSWLQQLTDV